MRNGVGYVRVSKARDDMVSPEIQRDAIEAYAERTGVRIVRWFEDLNKSGRTFEKRALREIVTGVEAGEYEAVVLWKWSRWGRNAATSGVYVNEVEAAGGKVYAATEDIDTSTAIGKFQRGFMFQLAELESDQKSEQWREAHGQRRKAGLPHTTNPRFGYIFEKGTGYTVNAKEAEVLADAYLRFVAGESMRSIAGSVNDRGFTSHTGKPFTPTSWGRLMDTGFAAGLIRERSPERLAELRRIAEKRGKTVSDIAKSTLADFDVWRDGSHEPVIDRATWEAYRRLRLDNAAKAPHHIAGKYAFTGLLVCDLCDTKMVSQVARSAGKHNWRCRKVLESKTCKGVTLSDRKLTAAVLAWVEREAVGDGSDVAAQAERLAASKAATTELAGLKAEAVKVERRRANLTDMREHGEIDRTEYLSRRQAIDADAERLARLIAEAEAREAAGGTDLRPVFQSIRDTWEAAEGPERRQMLSQVLQCIRVAPGGVVTPVPLWTE